MRLSTCQKCGASPELSTGADSRYNEVFVYSCCSHKTAPKLEKCHAGADWNEAQAAFKKKKTFPKPISKAPLMPVPDAYSAVIAAIAKCTDPDKLEAVKEYGQEIKVQIILDAVAKRFRELEPLAHAANMLDLLK